MKKYLLTIIALLIPFTVNAGEVKSNITMSDNSSNSRLTDKKENSYSTIKSGTNIDIKSESNMSGLYIVYQLSSKTGKLTCGDNEYKVGENGFLHEYIKIDSTTECILTYDEEVKIGDIYTLDDGELPEFVEVWERPCEKADLMLLSSHSDDEQLFFLGLLPRYIAAGADVQVVYFTNHNDTPSRLHEQLHGLYVVGVRHYPIIGFVPDAFSKTLDGALSNAKRSGLTEEEIIKFQVEMIRRFKPQVVVGHDEKGEYSHGQHILNTYTLEKALELTNKEDYDEESVTKYGVYDVPKVYLHLYEKNPIVMDYDTPLDYFDGKTAYEMSKLGYKQHNSQQWTWFTKWINGKNNEYTKSTDIKTYSPNQYGLYKTTVGEDKNKNDMFENLIFYKDQVVKTEEVKVEKTTKKIQIKEKEHKKLNIFDQYKVIIISVSLVIMAFIILFILLKIIKRG